MDCKFNFKLMLYSAHLGNGLSVWRRGENDFIAHIDSYRNIKYRVDKKSLTKEEIKEIEQLSKEDNRTISVTQNEKVFKTKINEIS